MRPRTVEPFYHSATSTTRSCKAPGCHATTREGKPYCPEHVEFHPYVQEILEILDRREEEEQLVRKRGPSAVDPEGLTAKELMLHLSLHGSRTVERLSREFQLDATVMGNYVRALRNRGLVVLGRTTRGSTVVRLSA